MKKNRLTLTVGILLVLVFGLLLFVFQVRTTRVAVVTTFGRPTRPITKPGAYFKWPWPIQKVYQFDRRIHNFEDQFEETLTKDNFNLLIKVFAGYAITKPDVFLQRFANGSIEEAEKALSGLIRSAKNAVVGQYQFSDFISTDPEKVKLAEVERKILEAVQTNQGQYGIAVEFLGIKRLGLPESITEKVIARMEAERQRVVDQLEGQGEEQATIIRSNAERERDRILAEAGAAAKRIRGQGDAEAAKYFSIFEENPELAIFLLKLDAMEKALHERSTLVVDQRTEPFDLLSGGVSNRPNGTAKNEATEEEEAAQ